MLATAWGIYVLGAMAAGGLIQMAPAVTFLVPVAILLAVVAIAAARYWRA